MRSETYYIYGQDVIKDDFNTIGRGVVRRGKYAIKKGGFRLCTSGVATFAQIL